jgi:hypothetical protein
MTAHEALQKLSQLESRGFDPKLLNALCEGNLDAEVDEEFFDWLYPCIKTACKEYKEFMEFTERVLEMNGVIHVEG